MNPDAQAAAGNRIAIVFPREPMPGALAVAVPEERLKELDALERAKEKRIWKVRGVVSDHIPLAGDIRSGLLRKREHLFFLNESPLAFYLHRGGRDATYFDLVADAERRLDYVEVRVEARLPSNAFLYSRQPLNELLDTLVRNPPHPLLILQRLELVSPFDGNILAYEVTLPFMNGVIFGPMGGILQSPVFAPYYAIYREAVLTSSPFYRLLCAWRVYEGIQTIRQWLREQCRLFKIEEKLPKDPEVDRQHLERMGCTPEFCARIRRMGDLFDAFKELRNGIAHFLFEAQERDAHVYLASGEQIHTYSSSAAILLGYASRCIEELRMFYSQHIEHRIRRGWMLPTEANRDQFIAREPEPQ